MLTILGQSSGSLGLPEKASTFAASVDPLWAFLVWLSVLCFMGIGGTMFWFAWKYRRRSHDDKPHAAHHNTVLELTWSGIPLIIVLAIFVWGFRGYLDMAMPDAYADEVLVQAVQWNWTFQYPNGASSDELHVKVGQPVRLVLTSSDVIHSFYVPQFRIKKDVVPGRYNTTWFKSDVPGVYDLYCAEYCGTKHSQMNKKVYVHTEADYEAWKKKALDPYTGNAPKDVGSRFYETKGCAQCHTTDGSPLTGPSFKDLFGSERQFTDGTSQVADEQYIRESIRNPSAKIVKGYKDQMSMISLNDREIDMIIAFLKSISTNYEGPTAPLETPIEAEGGQDEASSDGS